jgi:hypothetical protein
MALHRLAATPWLHSTAQLRAVGTLAGAPYRVLSAFTAPSVTAGLTPRLPKPPGLASLLGTLQGRLVVTNPCAAARLPRHVADIARAALRQALRPATPADAVAADAAALPTLSALPTIGREDPRDAAEARRLRAFLAALPEPVREALAPGAATWGAVALYEPTALDVRFVELPMPPAAPEPLPAFALSRYRLAIVVGRGEPPPDWGTLDAACAAAPSVTWPVGSEPFPWFALRVLVSDAAAAHSMDPTTLARWAALTGRAGATSRDVYWFADTWQRFGEPQRRVGHVTPAAVARSRRRLSAPEPSLETYGSLAPALNPGVERGVTVPPGYCLVDCVGTLDIAVATI